VLVDSRLSVSEQRALAARRANHTMGCIKHSTASQSKEVIIPQNHKMVAIARDLWGSSSPTPLPKQGHLEQSAQDLVLMGFEYHQRRTLHNRSGKPVPVLCHPQSEVLPYVQMLHFGLIAPCPVTGHH